MFRSLGLRHQLPRILIVPIISSAACPRASRWVNLMSLRILAAAVLMLAMAGAARNAGAADAARSTHAPIIVFLTDYGTLDDAVAICKGVMLGIAPDVRIVDLTHQVTPYSISEGGRLLSRAALYFPAGTIFVGVVDPGVGTHRRAIIAKSGRGQYFVVPDNGLLTVIEERDGIKAAREITNPAWQLPGAPSSTFHGRDIFSPAAAHLARAEDFNGVGPPVAHLIRLELKPAAIAAEGIKGRVVALDGPFGNLITNVSAELFRGLGYKEGDKVRLKIGGLDLIAPYVATFGDVPVGQPLLFIDSSNLVSVAINQGNFAQAHRITPPVELTLSHK
jgi:S-adenosylmethionine hydrolase